MTILLECIEYDMRITKRITPFYNVHSVYASHQGAVRALKRIQKKYDKLSINSDYEDGFLVISDVPGRALTKIWYKLVQSTLYGDSIQDVVYNLRKFNGYIRDQDKPFRYDNLGWFSSPYWGKATKEWQIMRHIITTNDLVDGMELDLEIKIFGPYDSTDLNPSLALVPYKLYK